MVLVVDDILSLPIKIGEIIFNSITQTAYKTAWIGYQKQLNNMLIRAKYDRETGKLSEKKYQKIESYIFREMRIVRRILATTK